MSNMRGKLFVVSGPSGAGKGTIVGALMSREQEIELSVSATTRAPRPGEMDGVHYHFISQAEFEGMIERGELLEYAKYLDTYYGTPVRKIEQKLDAGIDVILEIDIQGGFQVKEKMPDTVLIFVLPPDMEELERRLRGRGSEPEEKIAARLERALHELREISTYDYIITNQEVYKATGDLESIIRAERLRRERCLDEIKGGVFKCYIHQ